MTVPRFFRRSAAHAGAAAATLLLSACMASGRVAPDRLTPVSARVTDEAIARDLALIESMAMRVRRAAPDTSTYLAARALAYLSLARDAYERNDRSTFVDDAMAWARADLTTLEQGGASPSAVGAPVPASLRTAAPELWGRADSLRRGLANGGVAGAALAGAEANLSRAAHPFLAGLACLAAGDAPLAMAQTALAALATPRPLIVPERPAPVPVADEPLPARPARCAGPEELRGVPGTVHFALDRSSLSDATRAVLDRAVTALAPHSTVRIRLSGHTDVRASDAYNQALSERRVAAVRDYLVARGLDAERIDIQALGEGRPMSGGSALQDHARNRRVELRYVLCDGQEIPLVEELSDLQLEAARRRQAQREKD